MKKNYWNYRGKRWSVSPLSYVDILGYCPKCKDMIFRIPILRSVVDKNCEIDCSSDILWDGCLQNEIEIKKNGDDQYLIHSKCGEKIRLYKFR